MSVLVCPYHQFLAEAILSTTSMPSITLTKDSVVTTIEGWISTIFISIDDLSWEAVSWEFTWKYHPYFG